MDGKDDIWAMQTVDEVRTGNAEECWSEWLVSGVVDGVVPGRRRHRMRVTVAHKFAGRSCLEAQLWVGKAPVEMGEVQSDEMSARKERQEMDGASRVAAEGGR